MADLSPEQASKEAPISSVSVANPDIKQQAVTLAVAVSDEVKAKQDALREQLKQYLTLQLQKGQLAATKAKEIALRAREIISAIRTGAEAVDVMTNLAKQFPESLDGLLVEEQEKTSRTAELEISDIVVTWVKEGKVDWAISLAREAAESPNDVAILQKIKQEIH